MPLITPCLLDNCRGVSIKVPNNLEGALLSRYGPTWRVPRYMDKGADTVEANKAYARIFKAFSKIGIRLWFKEEDVMGFLPWRDLNSSILFLPIHLFEHPAWCHDQLIKESLVRAASSIFKKLTYMLHIHNIRMRPTLSLMQMLFAIQIMGKQTSSLAKEYLTSQLNLFILTAFTNIWIFRSKEHAAA